MMTGAGQELKFGRTLRAMQAFSRAVVIGAVVFVGAGLVRNVTSVLQDAFHGTTFVEAPFVRTAFLATPIVPRPSR
jgi:hypothetical protein